MGLLMFIFKVDGIDMPIPAMGGFDLSFADLDGPGSGRNARGFLRRDRKRAKMRQISVSYPALNDDQVKEIMDALNPAIISVTYNDPQIGEVTKQMYISSISLPIYSYFKGYALWENMSFTLAEV
jgi:hypothetical protein